MGTGLGSRAVTRPGHGGEEGRGTRSPPSEAMALKMTNPVTGPCVDRVMPLGCENLVPVLLVLAKPAC